MSVESLNAAVWDVLSRVNDPEIHKPITELGMVEQVEVDDTGHASVKVLLTISGCPMKGTIELDVHAALQQVLKRKDVGRVDAGNVGHAGFLARGEQDPASAVVVLNPLRGGASVADDFDAELDELALLHLEKLRD